VDEKVTYSVSAGVARLKLNRPEKRNALDAEMTAGLYEALEHSTKDNAVRAVVIAAAGQDFCAGADLGALQGLRNGGPIENLDDARRLAELFLAMRRHPRPIIACVRGRALAGGCGIATACDIILAAESAQFGYPETKIGFVPAMVMAMLRRSVTEHRAFELLVMGEPISASTAFHIGLVNRVFSDASFETEAEAYISQLASRSASAIALTKNLLYQTDGMAFEAAVSAGIQTNTLARLTDDYKRGLDNFLKKH